MSRGRNQHHVSSDFDTLHWTNSEPRFERVGLLQVLLCRCRPRHVEKMTGWVTCYWHPLPQILQYHIDRETCHYWSGRLRILQVLPCQTATVPMSLTICLVLHKLWRLYTWWDVMSLHKSFVYCSAWNWPLPLCVRSPGRSMRHCFHVASLCSVLLENQQLSQHWSQICRPIKQSRWQPPLCRAKADPRSVLSIRCGLEF